MEDNFELKKKMLHHHMLITRLASHLISIFFSYIYNEKKLCLVNTQLWVYHPNEGTEKAALLNARKMNRKCKKGKPKEEGLGHLWKKATITRNIFEFYE